ncbi:MAG: hypothetical protein ACE5KV_05230, partial [Thermoplasmata archaeon]
QLQESRRSLWLWLLQRISSVGLIIVLLIHMIALHYIDPSAEITLVGTQTRLQSLLFVVVDSLLLGLVIFHALNGVRNVAYDYWSKPGARKLIASVLFFVGIITFTWGAFILFKLIFPG